MVCSAIAPDDSTALASTRCPEIVFCAQRDDVGSIACNTHIDPAFGAALRRAVRAGVRTAGLRCAAHLEGMEIKGEIPVLV